MRKLGRMGIFLGFLLSVSLIVSAITGILTERRYGQASLQVTGEILQRIIEKQPESKAVVLEALREIQNGQKIPEEENLLIQFGYQPNDLFGSVRTDISFLVFASLGAGGTLFILMLYFWRKKSVSRIQTLTSGLEKVNAGEQNTLFQAGEDDFSKLEDEIYKTVTALIQTRESALKARDSYSENLTNIAHQIKTPITSISLNVQMMSENADRKYLDQIQEQLSRLTRLEDSLLLLSRIDTGVLPLERKPVDVYTLLMLAADDLQELLQKADVSVEIPELEAVSVQADPDWTVEAIINLMKNCMDHTSSGGKIVCTYEQNPLYTQITIRDSGPGFAKEDLPHLFERFYRGKNAVKGGIGIGLSLAKGIIERENGTIRAMNLPDGGACFEVRFYCH